MDPDDLDKQLVKLKRRLRQGEILDLDAFTNLVRMPRMMAAMEACGIFLTEPSQVIGESGGAAARPPRELVLLRLR